MAVYDFMHILLPLTSHSQLMSGSTHHDGNTGYHYASANSTFPVITTINKSSASFQMLEAHIPRVNLRVFGRALAVLSKINDSIIFESFADRLTISALSQTQSVYATFTFLDTFFTYFHHIPHSINVQASRHRIGDRKDANNINQRSSPPSSTSPISSSHNYMKVRVNSRSCCLPFRSSLSSIDSVMLKLSDEDDEGFAELEGAASLEDTPALIIQLRIVAIGITKTYRSEQNGIEWNKIE